MAFEINEGQVFLHANKSDNDKAPTIKGEMKIDGVLYEVALWPAKSGKEGSYSGKVKVKAEKNEKRQEPAKRDEVEEVPF
jgi:hypothetical protein